MMNPKSFARWWTHPVILCALSFGSAQASAVTDPSLRAQMDQARLRPAVPALPRSAFLRTPSISSVSLSADGRHVAWLREQGRSRELWVQSTLSDAPRRLLPHATAESVSWSRDGRWLLLESPREVFALAVEGEPDSGIVTTLGGCDQRELLAMDDTRPAAVIVLERAGCGAQPGTAPWRLQRVDMRGKRELLHESASRITDYALDARGRLAWLQTLEGAALIIHRVDAAGITHETLRCEHLQRCNLLSTSGDGGLWLRGDVDGNLNRLLRLGQDGAMQTAHSDPSGEMDLDSVTLDPVSRQPLIVGYRSITSSNHDLDVETRAHMQRIGRLLSTTDLRITPGRGDGAHWLVEERASDLQGRRWHLYEPREQLLRPLMDDAPIDARSRKPAMHVPSAQLAPKIPVHWQASDGMVLNGFVMLPPGVDPSGVPLVVLVHGGPWNHARPEFGSIQQFLVNRGYAVFEPNFRGSTGSGRAYMLAANGDFGNGRVQRDIVEGARTMLEHGIGDPRRVGIVGASFGGYSALLGITWQPEFFKVGVAIVPPPDFAWTLRWTLRNPEAMEIGRLLPMQDLLRMLALDVDDRVAMGKLHAQSPLANVGRLNRPLLMIAGGEDRRVGISGVIEYAARLKVAGKDVSLLVDAEAGHANKQPVAREAVLFLLETMLHRHLDGAAPEPADGEIRAYVRSNLRLEGLSLKDY